MPLLFDYWRYCVHSEVASFLAGTTMLTRLLLLIALALPLPALAGTTVAKISQILLYEAAGLVYVYPVGGVQSPPPCQASNVSFYSFSFSRPRSKEYLAALLAAQARNATMIFQGTGACTDHDISETLGVIVVQ